MKILIGQEVKERITGFKGIVIGLCQYVTGCNQALVQPKMEKSTFIESRWFDVDRLEVTKSTPFEIAISSPGFDKEAPRR